METVVKCVLASVRRRRTVPLTCGTLYLRSPLHFIAELANCANKQKIDHGDCDFVRPLTQRREAPRMRGRYQWKAMICSK